MPTYRGGSSSFSFNRGNNNDAVLSPLLLSTAATLGASIIVQLITPADPWGKSLRFLKQLGRQERGNLTSASNVESSVHEYERLHANSTSVDERNSNYTNLVNSYYDLATLFYEWGWGASFHFSNRHAHESFEEATRRHEFYLASKLNLSGALGKVGDGMIANGVNDGEKNGSDEAREGSTPSMARVKVLDVGCGIGGPMRNICKFTGADVTGLTLNQYQVDRGNELSRADAHFRNTKDAHAGLADVRCRSVQGDFMKQPFEQSSFDAAYAIEATCHAPDRVGCYSEIYRVLKPGAIFACYEWCLTDKYDAENQEHVSIKKQIEEGDGLPDIASTHHCLTALKKAGFEILEERDLVNDEYGGWQVAATGEYSTSKEACKHRRGGKPWMLPLMPSWNPFTQRFQFNWFGLRLTKYSLKVMEFLRLAPAGTSRTQILLQSGGMGLALGGEQGIFTPMYLMVGRVPLNKED
eukprot:CAMPEP_0172298884 /NCGR_PEP_ID=MMETSP1058-20130122/1330_1 /TAXON_ID=83371 /ORGANISM="Detonula confervacea, Strain CCMP 353" /LENGTH=467 /DNA_ID=CAMNT_0013008179 /DNA_START=18 /DNA_END=1421 /DNA_ORIENTATION=+